MQITYITVSVDAIITEAQREAKESGPLLERISLYVASDALPEIGRVRIKGKSSFGTPIISKNGASRLVIYSQAPDFVNILTPTISATIVGSKPIAVFAPPSLPLKKLAKKSFFFEKRIIRETSSRIRGKTKYEIFSIFSTDFTYNPA